MRISASAQALDELLREVARASCLLDGAQRGPSSALAVSIVAAHIPPLFLINSSARLLLLPAYSRVLARALPSLASHTSKPDHPHGAPLSADFLPLFAQRMRPTPHPSVLSLMTGGLQASQQEMIYLLISGSRDGIVPCCNLRAQVIDSKSPCHTWSFFGSSVSLNPSRVWCSFCAGSGGSPLPP